MELRKVVNLNVLKSYKKNYVSSIGIVENGNVELVEVKWNDGKISYVVGWNALSKLEVYVKEQNSVIDFWNGENGIVWEYDNLETAITIYEEADKNKFENGVF